MKLTDAALKTGIVMTVLAALLTAGCTTPASPTACTPMGSDIFASATGVKPFLEGWGPGFHAVRAENRLGFVFHDSAKPGIFMRVWDGSSWTTQTVRMNAANTVNSSNTGASFQLGELGGKFEVIYADGPAGANGVFEHIEQADGTYSAASMIVSGTRFIAGVASNDSLKKIALVTADESSNIYFAEKAANGSWQESSVGVAGIAVGLGYEPDGTAWVAYVDTFLPSYNLYLMRRTGLNWSVEKTLASNLVNGFYNATVFASPINGAAPRLVATWTTVQGGNLQTLNAATYDFNTVTGPSIPLAGVNVGSANGMFANVSFTEDGGDAILSVYDNTGSRAWLGSLKGNVFSQVREDQSSQVIQALPFVVYDSCGGGAVLLSSEASSGNPSQNTFSATELQPAQY